MAVDRQQLAAMIAAVNIPLPSIHIFETLASTNETLWNLAEKGFESGTVVIATQQTAGRGQWGRQWSSLRGGLYLSVAIAPNLPVQNSYQLTLCSAWGIATALRDRGIPVGIKWPNDLILCGRKLGGILTETKIQQGRITKAVVGVGINWANSVPTSGINLQSYQANHQGVTVNSLEMLAVVTLSGIVSGNQRLQAIDTLLPDYQKLLINMGHAVCVDGRSGIIVGITSSGELRVRLCSMIDPNLLTAPEICLKPGTISLGYSS